MFSAQTYFAAAAAACCSLLFPSPNLVTWGLLHASWVHGTMCVACHVLARTAAVFLICQVAECLKGSEYLKGSSHKGQCNWECVSGCFSSLQLTSVSDEMKIYCISLFHRKAHLHPTQFTCLCMAYTHLPSAVMLAESLNTWHLLMEYLSLLSGPGRVTAWEFRDTAGHRGLLVSHTQQIRLRFLVESCCWRVGEGAGWGVGRYRPGLGFAYLT